MTPDELRKKRLKKQQKRANKQYKQKLTRELVIDANKLITREDIDAWLEEILG